jgi:chromosome partitioning protein
MPRPTVIVLASQKGGVGKTALSAHLAVAAEMTGAGPVVLYDTDPQQSLAEWWRERDANTPQLAKGGIPELPATLDRLGDAGARLVIIDTPPALTDAIRSVMRYANFVLVPTQDGITDLKAIGRTVQLIRELDRPYAFALTFVKPGTSQATEAAMALSKFGPLAGVICHRMLFKTAFNDSRTAQEIEPKGKAAAEVQQLWDYLGQTTGLIKAPKKDKQHV